MKIKLFYLTLFIFSLVQSQEKVELPLTGIFPLKKVKVKKGASQTEYNIKGTIRIDKIVKVEVDSDEIPPVEIDLQLLLNDFDSEYTQKNESLGGDAFKYTLRGHSNDGKSTIHLSVISMSGIVTGNLMTMTFKDGKSVSITYSYQKLP
ncbi:hypothetical protein [Winogradskyella aurantiaca]|uniref:hypothetical protein n=1 Tax=Winogradskyella aurantiaca TaxID=2219558 RepID=UPI000E1D5EBC|nr:hypothetical protein [Winogradskyella aurantiaca]